MSLLGACQWLADTRGSAALRESLYMYPGRRRKVTMADEMRVRPIWFKIVALASLTLWLGVGAGGRWIGFSG